MLTDNNFNFRAGEDLKNNEGNTPLHLACEKPNLEIMLFLLMQGSDYTIKNNKGYKPGENTLDARMSAPPYLASSATPSSPKRRPSTCWARSRSRN